MTQSAVSAAPTLRRAPWYIFTAAWAVPTLVLGQFALLAGVPIAVVLVASIRSARLRAMRWRVGALAVAYATPVTIWLLRSERAPSLSKDMHPVFLVLITLVSVIVILKLHTRRKR